MPGTPKNIAAIEAARDELLRAANMLQAVLDGRSTLTTLASETGMTPQRVNIQLHKAFRPYIKSRFVGIADICERVEALRSPADRFMLDILDDVPEKGRPKTNAALVVLPDYDEEILWDVAYEALTRRQYDVLSALYGEKTGEPMDAKAVGAQFCVTAERIHQIRRKALRKMRHPARLKLIFPAIETRAVHLLGDADRALERSLLAYKTAIDRYDGQDLLKQATESFSAGKYPGDVTMAELRRIFGEDAISKAMTPKEELIPIGMCELSARAYNCLHRANVDTLNQVAAMDVYQIRRIRNIGRGTMREIGLTIEKYLGVKRPDLTGFGDPEQEKTERNETA